MWRIQCLDTCSLGFWEEPAVPLCMLDYDTMKASNIPTCKICRGIARPHILMFGDGEYVGHPEQEKNFGEFIRKLPDLAILVGSSGNIPTNDYIALSLQDRGTKVININPDPSSNRIVNTSYFLELKSEEALIKLNNALN